MQIKIKQWKDKGNTIAIKDRTVIQRYLPLRIPTTLAMFNEIAKI